MEKGIEEFVGKTKDELLKLGAKPTNLPSYLSVKIDGANKILKLDENDNKYYLTNATNANHSLNAGEKHNHFPPV